MRNSLALFMLLASPSALAQADDDAEAASPAEATAAPAEVAAPAAAGPPVDDGAAVADTSVGPAPGAAPPIEAVVDPLPDVVEAVIDPCPDSVPCLERGGFALWPSMRLRAGYEFVQPDDDVLFVGHNDGFFLSQARIGFETTYRQRFWVRLVLDMSTTLPGAKRNDPVQPLVGAARDAFVAWTPSEYFFIAIGQQFMPFDYEGQVTRGVLNFTSRSVATDGVRPGHGFEVEGLAPNRQVGVVVGARKAPVGPVNLDYRLALTNGNEQNRSGNDNKLPAVIGRLGASLNDWVGAGLAAQLNPRTTGELPNLFTETHFLLAGDFRLDVFGIDLLAQAIWRRISFDDAFLVPTDPNAADQSFGMTTWIVLDEPFGLPMFGFKPGYRFSYFDPYFSDPDDQLIENTVSVRYDPPTPLPLAFFLEATMLTEHAELDAGLRDSPRHLDNNRVIALLQFDL